MDVITIRELHINTGRWIRHAAENGPVVVTDRGRRIAWLQPMSEERTGSPLPDREARIRARGRIKVDSSDLVSQSRDRA